MQQTEATPPAAPKPGAEPRQLRELALLFLRLGTTCFGGPAAHTAIMEDEFVRRRGWITHERFLDLLGAVNLIPGPNSTEMAIYIGYLRAGWRGLLLGGICFILPAMVLVTLIAWAYVEYGSLPQFASLLYGVKPVLIAIIAQALWGLGRKAIKTKLLAALAVLVIAGSLLGLDGLSMLLGAGVVVALARGVAERGRDPRGTLKALAVMAAVVVAIIATVYLSSRIGAAARTEPSLSALFLYFTKVGSILYGSGYVLLAFIQTDLVDRFHWLSTPQLLDATAVGQVTPGPLFTTATFIGYLLNGLPGAVVATVGIFLPSFAFVAVSGPLVPRLRQSPIAGAFLDGVIVASLALMAAVTWQLARSALIDLPSVLLAAGSALLLVRFRVSSSWLVLGGAVIGLLVKGLGA